jgi:type II secretory pathway pseudopilin PulG
MDDVARLGAEFDSSGLVKGTRDLDRLGDQAAKTEKKVVSAGRGASGAMAEVGESGRRAGAGFTTMSGPLQQLSAQSGGVQNMMRQMSFQLSQVGQQGAATGNIFQALMIQLPDMLGLFGSIPLVLAGAAAGLATALLPAMIDTSGGVKQLEDDLKSLNDAIAAYSRAASLASLSTDEMDQRFGSASQGLQMTIAFLEEIARSEAQRKIDDINKSISEMMQIGGDGDRRTGIADFFDADIFLAFTDAQREARKEARLLTGEFLRQQDALDATAGDLDAQITALDEMLRVAVELADISGGRSEKEAQLITHLSETLQIMIDQRAAIRETQNGFEFVRDAAEEFAKKLLEGWGYANDLQSAVSGIDFSTANAGASALVARLGQAWAIAQAITKRELANRSLEYADLAANVAAYGGAQESMRQQTAEQVYSSDGRLPSVKLPKPAKAKKAGGSKISDAEREAERLHNERLREAERITRDLETATQRYNRELADLVELQELGYLSAGEFAKAQEALKIEFAETEFGHIIDGVEDLSRTLIDAARNGQNVGEALRNWILDALIEAQLQRLTKAMTGLFAGMAGGGGGGLFGGLFGALFGGRRAAGGPVMPGRAYMVGERGPEPFIPTAPGTILPSSSIGGGDVTVVVNNNTGQPIKQIDEGRDSQGRRLVRLEVADAVNDAMTNRASPARKTLQSSGFNLPRPRR